jgi:hypothetical protein
MESRSDLCFGARKMAAERCKAKQTGLQVSCELAVVAEASIAGGSRRPVARGSRESAR